jgi:putative SOS response-associated peptidase YedK
MTPIVSNRYDDGQGVSVAGRVGPVTPLISPERPVVLIPCVIGPVPQRIGTTGTRQEDVGGVRDHGGMCGRYASFRDAQDIADDLALAEIAEDARLLPPSWNVAPTDSVRIVVERPRRIDGRNTGEITRSMRVARWGLVPSWAKDPGVGARMINARSETLLSKSAFARPLAVRRCLLPADGYFEWRKLPAPEGAPARAGAKGKTPKQAYWIHPAGGEVAALAGLYEFWRDGTLPGDHPRAWWATATVITTPSSIAGTPPPRPSMALTERSTRSATNARMFRVM